MRNSAAVQVNSPSFDALVTSRFSLRHVSLRTSNETVRTLDDPLPTPSQSTSPRFLKLDFADREIRSLAADSIR